MVQVGWVYPGLQRWHVTQTGPLEHYTPWTQWLFMGKYITQPQQPETVLGLFVRYDGMRIPLLLEWLRIQEISWCCGQLSLPQGGRVCLRTEPTQRDTEVKRWGEGSQLLMAFSEFLGSCTWREAYPWTFFQLLLPVDFCSVLDIEKCLNNIEGDC